MKRFCTQPSFQPGTYDSLAHMFITPIPTPGSSGGPIIDLESGSVVGVIRGSRMDNRISGLKGWATSAESVYEVGTTQNIAGALFIIYRCSACQDYSFKNETKPQTS